MSCSTRREAALELLLLLLLPHAATTIAAATAATARRPKGLILPDTKSPFLHDRMGNHSPCAGPAGNSPNVPFTHGQHRPGSGGAYAAKPVRGGGGDRVVCRTAPSRSPAGGSWRAGRGPRSLVRIPMGGVGRARFDAVARVRRLPRALSAGADDRGDGAGADGLAATAGAAGGGAAGGFGVCGGGRRRVRPGSGRCGHHHGVGVRVALPGGAGGAVCGRFARAVCGFQWPRRLRPGLLPSLHVAVGARWTRAGS